MKMVLLGDDSELGGEKAELVRKNVFIENANVRGRKVSKTQSIPLCCFPEYKYC